MAWSWSHTAEAYEFAEAELRKLPKETLAEIFAEWKATTYGPEDSTFEDRDGFDIAHFNQEIYSRWFEWALRTDVPNSELADNIWNLASEQRTCDNGGYNAWMCPYGCMPHCVDFGPEDEDDKALY